MPKQKQKQRQSVNQKVDQKVKVTVNIGDKRKRVVRRKKKAPSTIKFGQPSQDQINNLYKILQQSQPTAQPQAQPIAPQATVVAPQAQLPTQAPAVHPAVVQSRQPPPRMGP